MSRPRIAPVILGRWLPAIMCGLAFLVSEPARGAVTFSWGTKIGGATTNRIYNQDGIAVGNELTPANRTSPNIGCFVQLLRTPSGIVTAPIPKGNRAGGDNVVIGTSWICKTLNTPFGNGCFVAAPFSHTYPTNTRLFIRAWSKASQDYDGGPTHTNATIPIDPSIRYGDSEIYITTNASGSESFFIQSAFATTNTAVGHPLITTVTDPNGAINPSGTLSKVTAYYGTNLNFICIPNRYYHKGDVYVDGSNLGEMTNYLWTNIRSNGTIYATFRPDLTTTNGTPHWWLNQMGGMTDNFDAAEYTDLDSDGYLAWQEYVSGTVPTNPQSVFEVVDMARVRTNRTVSLSWMSLSNRQYAIMWSTNTQGFVVFTNAIRGTPPKNTWVDNVHTTAESGFYRIQVQ